MKGDKHKKGENSVGETVHKAQQMLHLDRPSWPVSVSAGNLLQMYVCS